MTSSRSPPPTNVSMVFMRCGSGSSRTIGGREYIEHTVGELVAQRVYGVALGYEDLNDHDQLRLDPLLAVLVEKRDPLGTTRKRAADRGAALAGKSTLNRLELTPAGDGGGRAVSEDRPGPGGRRPAVGRRVLRRPRDGAGVDHARCGCHRRSGARAAGGAVLPRLLRPLLLSAAVHLLRRAPAVARLRPADHDAAAGAVEEVERIVTQIRARWPAVKIVVRGDSGFCRERLLAWCERRRRCSTWWAWRVTRAWSGSSSRRWRRRSRTVRAPSARRGAFTSSPIRRARAGAARVGWSARRRSSPARPQSAVRRHQPRGRQPSRPAALRAGVLCPRRHGEPHQGAAARSVRRSHQHRDPALTEPRPTKSTNRGPG